MKRITTLAACALFACSAMAQLAPTPATKAFINTGIGTGFTLHGATIDGNGAGLTNLSTFTNGFTLYVDPSGLDSNPGTKEKPFASPGAACSNCPAFGAVFVNAGTYAISNAIIVQTNRALIGAGNGVVLLKNYVASTNGACVVPRDGSYVSDLFISNAIVKAGWVQACYGNLDGTNFSGRTARLIMHGDTDAAFLTGQVTRWTDEGSKIEASGDTVLLKATTMNTATFVGTTIIKHGPPVNTGADGDSIDLSNGQNLTFINCSIFSTNNLDAGFLACRNGTGSITLVNCKVDSSEGISDQGDHAFTIINPAFSMGLDVLTSGCTGSPFIFPQWISANSIVDSGNGVAFVSTDFAGGLSTNAIISSTGLRLNVATNSTGATVKGQLPINVNGITYYLDLKR